MVVPSEVLAHHRDRELTGLDFGALFPLKGMSINFPTAEALTPGTARLKHSILGRRVLPPPHLHRQNDSPAQGRNSTSAWGVGCGLPLVEKNRSSCIIDARCRFLGSDKRFSGLHPTKETFCVSFYNTSTQS